MASIARLTKKKKARKVFSKRHRGGWDACPEDDFWAFKDYARTDLDKKDIAETIKGYIKKTYAKPDAKVMLKAPDWAMKAAYHVAATIEWIERENDVPANWNYQPLFDNFFETLKTRGEKEMEETGSSDEEPKVSIQEIVKRQGSDFIANIEGVIDEWMGTLGKRKIDVDIENYSVYNELLKIDASYNLAKMVYDYYLPIKDEIDLVMSRKCPEDLAEGYTHMKPLDKRRYQTLLTNIVGDAEKFMLGKKAVRKPRVKKTTPKAAAADKQVKYLKYMTSSPEHKLTSIDPIKIVGAKRLYVFDTKYKVFTEYVSIDEKGFEVKGTSLQNVDLEKSRNIKLRKPDEFLPLALKGTPNQINTEWKKLTTKTNTPNIRININTILLRAVTYG